MINAMNSDNESKTLYRYLAIMVNKRKKKKKSNMTTQQYIEGYGEI